jgi:hypothetical protein
MAFNGDQAFSSNTLAVELFADDMIPAISIDKVEGRI